MGFQLDYYDLLGVFVPGSLLLCWLTLCFPDLAGVVVRAPFPTGFAILALTVLSAFVGQVVQAIGSLAEPLYYRTWGGRTDDKAFEKGLGARYFGVEEAIRVKQKLEQATGGAYSNGAAFRLASQLSIDAKGSRTERFNTLFGYHRSLLTASLIAWFLAFASTLFGEFKGYSWEIIGVILSVLSGVIVLMWVRTRQRSYYFVREVLLTAERVLKDER